MTAPTREERREVAEAIRHYAKESDESAYEFIRGYWPNDLADLIDPTCTPVAHNYGSIVGNACPRCGWSVAGYMRYCPGCGARVVEDDGRE